MNTDLIKRLEQLKDEIDRPGDEPIREAIDEIADLKKQNLKLRKYADSMSDWAERGARIPKP